MDAERSPVLPTLGDVLHDEDFAPLRDLLAPLARRQVDELSEKLRTELLEGEAKATRLLLEAFYAVCDAAKERAARSALAPNPALRDFRRERRGTMDAEPTLGDVAAAPRFLPLQELLRPVAETPVDEFGTALRTELLEGEAKATRLLLEAFYSACDAAKELRGARSRPTPALLHSLMGLTAWHSMIKCCACV
jgi:hypothetical protein